MKDLKSLVILALILSLFLAKKLQPRKLDHDSIFGEPKVIYSSEDNDIAPFTSKKMTVEYRAKRKTIQILFKNYHDVRLRQHVSDILDVISVYSLLSEQKISVKPRFLELGSQALKSKVLDQQMRELRNSKHFAGRFARAVDEMYILKPDDFVKSRKLNILDSGTKRKDKLAKLEQQMINTMEKKSSKVKKGKAPTIMIDSKVVELESEPISAELFLEMKEKARKKSSLGKGPKERMFDYQKKMFKNAPKAQQERMLMLQKQLGVGVDSRTGKRITVQEIGGKKKNKKNRKRKSRKLKRGGHKKRSKKEKHRNMVEKIIERRRKLTLKKRKLAKLARNRRIKKYKALKAKQNKPTKTDSKKTPISKAHKSKKSRKLKTSKSKKPISKKTNKTKIKKRKRKRRRRRDRKTFGMPGMPGGGGVTQGAGVENLKVVINAIGQPSSYLPVEQTGSFKKGYNDADAEAKVIVTRLKLPGRFDSH